MKDNWHSISQTEEYSVFTTNTKRNEGNTMDERIKAIENLLRILAVNHTIVLKSTEPANTVIEVVDFIRQFSANLSQELVSLKEQASTKQQPTEVIDTESVLVPSVGNATQIDLDNLK